MKSLQNRTALPVLRQSIFEVASQAVSLMLVFALILLWAVSWPVFELSDWMTRLVKTGAKKSEAKKVTPEIGFGPRVVAAMLTFVVTARQTRQLERISRAQPTRGSFADLAGDSTLRKTASPAPVGDPYPRQQPAIEKLPINQAG